MLAIARNLLIDHHRREQTRRTEEIDELNLPTTPGPEEQVSSAAELTTALERARAIALLPYTTETH